MFVMLLFVILFIALAIYEEYHQFDKEASQIRKHYIEQQKETIAFDTNRVLRFIEHEYNQRRHTSFSEEMLKAQVLDAIEHLYGRQDGTGYIFIYSFEGVNLSDPVQTKNVGKNLYHFKDQNGVQVIKALIDASQKENGGYVNYLWVKPTSGMKGSKISYAKSFEPWGWMVGTGVYLDEVEKLISAEKSALKERVIKYMLEILSLAVILFGLGFILVRIVTYIITKEIDTFSRFFKKSSKEYTTIDAKEIQLVEFKKMVKYINNMIQEIHARKNRLKEMNISLEQKVAEKTYDLNEQNKLLEQEKSFSESLVKAQDNFIRHSIHEINTPLAVIMTHIDIYKMKNGENPYISKIEAASKMIANIYDDLGYMVKKDRLQYDKQWIDFTVFLQARILFFEEIASGNHHKIVGRIDKGIEIFFNDVELQRVIDNNLSNAIKFAKKDTDITVELRKEGNDAIMKFTTYSKKIMDSERIFEPFHREEDAKAGFGLGLEIVGGICQKENVELTVDSNDKTTLFTYRFKLGAKE